MPFSSRFCPFSLIAFGSPLWQHIYVSFSLVEWLFKKCISDHVAAAAAKSLQWCPTLCDPIDSSPDICLRWWLENCYRKSLYIVSIDVIMTDDQISKLMGLTSLRVCMLSCFSRVRLFVTPWIIACQALLSMGFSRQEYWSGLPFPPPGDLPNLETEPVPLVSPTLAGGFIITSISWEAWSYLGQKCSK